LSEKPETLTSNPSPVLRQPPDQVRGQHEGERGEAGNCRPALSARFRPGQSGNPRGRPKRARGVAGLVAKALAEKVAATDANGRKRTMTKLEAAVIQLVNAAVKGDRHSAQMVFNLFREDESRPAPPAPKHSSGRDAMIVAEIVRRLSRPEN
jgi:hypothetical protein